MAKLARRNHGKDFDCATWLHKARTLPKEEFRHEVEKELTGRDEEPSELIYIKVYKSQVPVIETAALMLGSDKSRGYCLEMICADFIAGANLEGGEPEVLLRSMSRYLEFLPQALRQAFLEQAQHPGGAQSRSKRPSGLIRRNTKHYVSVCCAATTGAASTADPCRTWKFITSSFVVSAGKTSNPT